MTQPCSLSFIIPTYNRAHLIGATLTSLLAQPDTDIEFIVVDDGSTDNTEAVVNGFLQDTRLQYVRKENAERAAARNFGARLAKGTYVNFFDSDDLALPHHAAEAKATIARFQQPEWFHLGFAWVTPEGEIFKTVNQFQGESLNALLPHGNPLSCNGVFVRKDIILAHPFNETRLLSASEDYELWYRLGAQYPLRYSNTVTSHIIDHDMRSVRTMQGVALIARKELLLTLLRNNPTVQATYGSAFHHTVVDIHSYLALHLSESAQWKKAAFQRWRQAVSLRPSFMWERRSLATLRNLLKTW